MAGASSSSRLAISTPPTLFPTASDRDGHQRLVDGSLGRVPRCRGTGGEHQHHRDLTQEIGERLQVSRQAARERFARIVEEISDGVLFPGTLSAGAGAWWLRGRGASRIRIQHTAYLTSSASASAATASKNTKLSRVAGATKATTPRGTAAVA
jgi:hypothetical protein